MRASLCHLVGGFTIGALLLACKGIAFGSGVWAFRSAVTAWLAFALLNSGVFLVSLGGLWVAAGRLAEIGAALSFAVHLWGRVSPAGLSAM